jgi:hypothetical protein
VIVLTARTTAEYGVWVEDVELAPAALIRTLQQAGLLVLLVSRDSLGGGDKTIDAIPGVAGVVSYADDQYDGTTRPSLEALEAAFGRPVLRVDGSGEIEPGELARFLERLSN